MSPRISRDGIASWGPQASLGTAWSKLPVYKGITYWDPFERVLAIALTWHVFVAFTPALASEGRPGFCYGTVPRVSGSSPVWFFAYSDGMCTNSHLYFTWVVVKIMVLFLVLDIIRHLVIRAKREPEF